jgi:hypothetical protein
MVPHQVFVERMNAVAPLQSMNAVSFSFMDSDRLFKARSGRI